MSRKALIAVVVVLAALAVWWRSQGGDGETVAVQVPQLSEVALFGEKAFSERCAVCHGKNGAGSNDGPPLIHKIYEPSHHGDSSFFAAIRFGVRQHHWPFGNMPPRPEVAEREAAAIVTYVREVQRANGIM